MLLLFILKYMNFNLSVLFYDFHRQYLTIPSYVQLKDKQSNYILTLEHTKI